MKRRHLTLVGLSRFVLLLVAAVLSMGSCTRAKPPRVKVGPDVQADVVVLFRPGASSQDINQFLEQAVFIGPADGEHWHRPGIQSILRVSVHGCQGYAISFHRGATGGQRDTIKNGIAASPIVVKVFEGMAPADIGPEQPCDVPA